MVDTPSLGGMMNTYEAWIFEDMVKEFLGKKFAVVLCGNVGTGKTTFLKNLINTKFENEFLSVDIDQIATMLQGGSYLNFNEKNFAIYGEVKRTIAEIIFKHGKLPIIDGMHFTSKMRKPFIDMAKANGYAIICVNFGRGSEESLARRVNEGRGKGEDLWRMVHNRTYNNFEEPSVDEGFTKVYNINS